MKRQLLILLIASVLFSACQSGVIPCPTIKTAKLKESTARQGRVKKYGQEESHVVAANARKQAYHLKSNSRTELLSSKVDVEEWDCPRPGTRQNQKMIKEHKRLMEKRVRSMMKKQLEMDSLAVN